jgi:hypothetical protein
MRGAVRLQRLRVDHVQVHPDQKPEPQLAYLRFALKRWHLGC